MLNPFEDLNEEEKVVEWSSKTQRTQVLWMKLRERVEQHSVVSCKVKGNVFGSTLIDISCRIVDPI